MERPETERSETRGAVIAFEGIDGAGKSTQVDFLQRELSRRHRDVRVFRLNGNKLFDMQCRALNDRDLLAPVEVALMKAAEMSGRIEYAVKPLVEQGTVVIWDKYLAASLAADAARGVPEPYVRALRKSMPEPDLTLYFDISPDEALERKRASGGPRLMETGLEVALRRPLRDVYRDWKDGKFEASVVEEHFRDFQSRQARAYESLLDGARVARFDASLPPENLAERVVATVGDFLRFPEEAP